MTYALNIKPNLIELFEKMGRRDRKQLDIIKNKVKEIRENPERYKNLRWPLNGWKRVHIDSNFVLTFSVDENSKTVTLEDYDHHDRIYLHKK